MKTINYHGKEIKLIDGIEYGLDGDPLTEIEISNINLLNITPPLWIIIKNHF